MSFLDLFSSKKTDTTNSSNQTAPWSPAQPMLQTILGGANDWLANAPNRQFYGGQTYAGMSDPTKAGMDRLAAGGGANTDASQGFLSRVLSGDFLSAGNPYFQQMAGSIGAGVMPGINATFSKAGMSGSDPHQYAVAKGMSDAIAPLAYQNYSQGMGNMMSAASAAPQLDKGIAGNMLGAGAIGEGYTQKGIDEAMARYNWTQNRPLMALQQTAGLVNPIAAMGSQSQGTSTTTSQTTPGMLQALLGTGMMGASLFGSGGMFPGAMSGAGGFLSSLFGGGSGSNGYLPATGAGAY